MSRIVAKHDGTCTSCSAAIIVGDEVEWSREAGARCLKCAKNGKQRHNQRADTCRNCGTSLPPGVGLLIPEFPPPVTWQGEQVKSAVPSSWRVECADKKGCAERVAARQLFAQLTHEQLVWAREALVGELRAGSATILDLSDKHGEVLVLAQGGQLRSGLDRAPEHSVLISSTTNDVWAMSYSGESDASWLEYSQRRAVEAFGVLLTTDLERRVRGLSITSRRI